jgi:hypothetical protein
MVRGPAGTLVARAWAWAARAAGARARSVVEPLGLAGERYKAAVALQRWQPGCVDKGNGGGGVSRLRRRRLESDKSW